MGAWVVGGEEIVNAANVVLGAAEAAVGRQDDAAHPTLRAERGQPPGEQAHGVVVRPDVEETAGLRCVLDDGGVGQLRRDQGVELAVLALDGQQDQRADAPVQQAAQCLVLEPVALRSGLRDLHAEGAQRFPGQRDATQGLGPEFALHVGDADAEVQMETPASRATA